MNHTAVFSIEQGAVPPLPKQFIETFSGSVIQIQVIQHFMIISEFVFLIVKRFCIFMELSEHVGDFSKFFIKVFLVVKVRGQRSSRYIFGNKDAIELFIDRKRFCYIYCGCSFFEVPVFIHHTFIRVIIFQPAGRFGKKFRHHAEILTLKLISTDRVRGIVLKNVNRTFFIPQPVPDNFFNKPVPERVSRT